MKTERDMWIFLFRSRRLRSLGVVGRPRVGTTSETWTCRQDVGRSSGREREDLSVLTIDEITRS